MGQQPNIELEPSDAPRRGIEPGTPSRWTPGRPGEIESPQDPPWGGEFGRPGPATGWALTLLRRTEYDRTFRAPETEALAATIVGARASLFGRAPTPADVEVALTLLGLRPDGLPAEVVAELVDARNRGLDHAAHELRKGTAFLAHLPHEYLESDPRALVSLLQRIRRSA